MIVIHAYRVVTAPDGTRRNEPIPDGQQRKDRMILQRMHTKACREVPLWPNFGGVLIIGHNRKYQVCE